VDSENHKTERDGSVTDGFILRYLEGLDSPRALTVWLLYKYREHRQLVDLDTRTDCEPIFGLRTVDMCTVDYLATEFLSKADFLSLEIDPAKVARGKFFDAEVHCRAVNRRLRLNAGQPDFLRFDGLIVSARRKIADVLGAFDPSEFIRRVDWGPGGTAMLSRKFRLRYDKFRLETGISSNCLDFWNQDLWDSAFPRWTPNREVQTAYLHTVPKTSKTDRCIVVEPGINTLLQKGLGLMLRSRLAAVGIRLRTQADDHRLLVPLAARSGSFATVDFSAASDTISKALVELLLPDDWLAILSSHRSECVRLEKYKPDVHVLEKFSSMGNGFTFELETLIFWALARAVCNRTEYVSVFGDDVILPSARLESYQSLVEYCGFSLNSRKSFSSGYFRESCGAHSFFGNDAKPVYLRSRIRAAHDILRTANQVRRCSSQFYPGMGCDGRFRSCWSFLTGTGVGRKYSFDCRGFYIPDGFGDFGLVVDFDTASPFVRRERSYQRGYLVNLLIPRYARVRDVDDYPLLLSKLFELKQEDSSQEGVDESRVFYTLDYHVLASRNTETRGNELPDFGSPIRVSRKRNTYVPYWSNLGPWLN